MPLGQRFWSKVTKYGPEGCWIWNASSCHGYGRFIVTLGDPTTAYAHRLAFEDKYGPVPIGHDLHHVCETKLCVNPDHMVVIEKGRHARIGQRQFYCRNGHLLAGSNYDAKRHSCLICTKAYSRMYEKERRCR